MTIGFYKSFIGQEGKKVSILGRIKTDIETAYDLYSDTLYRIALSHLHSDEDAQDAVHDVFIRYINSSPAFRDSNHEKAWFIRTTVNRCHDILRYKKVRNHITLDEISEITSDNSEKELQNEVIRLVSQLDDKYKSVIILHYLEGYSVKEISSILQISESNTKMRLARGRDLLKNIIIKEENDV